MRKEPQEKRPDRRRLRRSGRSSQAGGKNNGADSLEGSTEEGQERRLWVKILCRRAEAEQQRARRGRKHTKGTGQQGQHSAGTGGAATALSPPGSMSPAAQNRRDGGEKKDEERRQLSGEANPDSEQGGVSGRYSERRSRPYGSFQRGWRQGGKRTVLHAQRRRAGRTGRTNGKISANGFWWICRRLPKNGARSDTMLQGVKKDQSR